MNCGTCAFGSNLVVKNGIQKDEKTQCQNYKSVCFGEIIDADNSCTLYKKRIYEHLEVM